ncbi:unspecified product [Leishmania tarentolae]|uniref:Unspecified product n=1 Tax=Leishmania tarentolae TaxID=5689 RepID=A0A640KHT0_LEITA|nr:unspecified product [Leishmania tarentolae]
MALDAGHLRVVSAFSTHSLGTPRTCSRPSGTAADSYRRTGLGWRGTGDAGG